MDASLFASPMTKHISINNQNRGIAGPLQIKYCDTFLTQLRGFTLRPSLMRTEAVKAIGPFEREGFFELEFAHRFAAAGLLYNDAGAVTRIGGIVRAGCPISTLPALHRQQEA